MLKGTRSTTLSYSSMIDGKTAVYMTAQIPESGINRNIIILSEAAEAYNSAREKIIEEHTEKDSEGKPVVKDNSYVFKDTQRFNKDLEELLGIDTEVNLHTISEKDIEKCDDSRYDALTLADLDTLCVMIK